MGESGRPSIIVAKRSKACVTALDHLIQLTLADEQYVNLVVEQRGIDVVVKLFGPDGKSITEFDAESRVPGPESASLVAEAAGSYRLVVQSKMNRAAPGRDEIRILDCEYEISIGVYSRSHC
jgi:hypothetical protein